MACASKLPSVKLGACDIRVLVSRNPLSKFRVRGGNWDINFQDLAISTDIPMFIIGVTNCMKAVSLFLIALYVNLRNIALMWFLSNLNPLTFCRGSVSAKINTFYDKEDWFLYQWHKGRKKYIPSLLACPSIGTIAQSLLCPAFFFVLASDTSLSSAPALENKNK